jgi:hypothetical protein
LNADVGRFSIRQMTVRLVLHVLSGDVLLFQGSANECPPIPRAGDEIVHESRRVKLEGIQYRYLNGHVEISLFA